MLTEDIRNLIIHEERSIRSILSPSEAINRIYNLIQLKINYNERSNLHVLIKLLIDGYIKVIKSADFGYDTFNEEKLRNILPYLSYEEQISILQFASSRFAHELPEHDRDWLIRQKKIIEIKCIWKSKKFFKLPKIVTLFININLITLLITLFLIFISVYIVLYPFEDPLYPIFEISYENYSEDKGFNHFFNLLTLFVDLDNDFKIKPLNVLGVSVMVVCKFFFILIVANFLYNKFTDKITS